MSYIHQYQDALIITANVGQNISTAESVKIAYEKPDETLGVWDAVVYNSNYVRKVMEVGADELDQVGTWKFWAEITYSNGSKVYGTPYSVYVYARGQMKKT
jgi:hypothetical protein